MFNTEQKGEIICPCCQQKFEVYKVYFGNDMEAVRCVHCLVAFPK